MFPHDGNRVTFAGPLPPLAALATLVSAGSRDNQVVFGDRLRSFGLTILISGIGNRVEIGRDVTLSGRIRVCGNGLTVRIGDRSDIKAGKIVAWFGSVEIGEDCLFAERYLIRTSDNHPILEAGTGRRLNPHADVRIGDRVWLASEAAILKGAVVPSDCVVGMRSLVTQAFTEEGCVIAGIPARVMRRDIRWARHYDETGPVELGPGSSEDVQLEPAELAQPRPGLGRMAN